jgi:hypothetical protein
MKFTSTKFSAASGSEGGTTFSRNRYGMYCRTRAVPVNPNTARQQAVRNLFQQLADFWNSQLSAAQRIAWNLYGSQVTMLDKLGQEIFLTGFNHYLRSNTVVLAAPYPRVDDAPTIFTLAESDGSFAAAISEATQLVSVTFDTNLDWVGEDDAGMLIKMSRPVNAGQTFIPPVFRMAGFIDGDSGTPPTSPQTIACPFVATEGQNVLIEGRIVRADGRLSAPFRDSLSVAS